MLISKTAWPLRKFLSAYSPVQFGSADGLFEAVALRTIEMKSATSFHLMRAKYGGITIDKVQTEGAAPKNALTLMVMLG